MSDSAFPNLLCGTFYDNEGNGLDLDLHGGLTKRELFAAMALLGLLPVVNKDEDNWGAGLAEGAVKIADLLIAELAKKEGE